MKVADDCDLLADHVRSGGRITDLGWAKERLRSVFDETLLRNRNGADYPLVWWLYELEVTNGDVVTDDDPALMLDWYKDCSNDLDGKFELTWRTAKDFESLMTWTEERAQLALDELLREGKLIYDHPCYAMPEEPRAKRLYLNSR